MENDNGCTDDYDMATIRRAKSTPGASTAAKIAAFLALAVVAAIVVASQNPFAGPQHAGVRVLSNKAVEGSDGGEGGRMSTFELGGLKEGKTGTVTIQTKPDWAPIGVKRFHVSSWCLVTIQCKGKLEE